MTVGELKLLLDEIYEDDLPVKYLPPDSGLSDAYEAEGALLVEKATGKTNTLRGVYLLGG